MEDIWVHQNVINVPREDIVLMEIGAFDGIQYSNTYMLERCLECKPAFLVEPSPERVFHIRAKRPNSQILQAAVSSEFGTATFAGSSSVSGILDMMTDEYIQRWGIDKYNQIKIPISNKGRTCEDTGCEEIYDGDQINVPELNGIFNVKFFKFRKYFFW